MDSTTINLISIVLLLAVNGFFVAAEFALVKARGFRIETLANEGSKSAQLTVKIQSNLESYLAACQLGITMASLGLGWVGEPAVAAILEPLFTQMGIPDAMLHTTAFIVGFIVFSSLHIVVGEQVPKTLAIRKAEPVSLWCAYPLRVAYVAVYPLNWLLNKTTSIILRMFNIEKAGHGDVLSGEELKGLVATSKEHGEIEEKKANMLRNLFEFDQRQVGRVMLPRNNVQTLDLYDANDTNMQTIRDSHHSRFPVIDAAQDDKIIGIVLSKDLYTAMLHGQPEPWKDLSGYIRDPLVVPETQKVASLFETMRSHRAHMSLVVDEYGELAGIVTLEDLIEEIVGDIHDETDAEFPQNAIVQLTETQWQCDGLISLSDFEKTTHCKIPDDVDANTLSGYCMERLGRMPEAGDIIHLDGLQLQIKSVDDLRVGQVFVELLQPENENDSEHLTRTGDTINDASNNPSPT